jgi:hypothetical protein
MQLGNVAVMHQVLGEILKILPTLVVTANAVAVAAVLNSSWSTSRHDTERQRCLQRVDSMQVCTAC